MVANSLSDLQSEWEKEQTKRTPKEMVAFLVLSGYAPFQRLSKDRNIVVWVRKAYVRSQHVYPLERYRMRDATVAGGIRVGTLVDDSGVHYDPFETIKKLATFYHAPIEDFVSIPFNKSLEQVAKNFAMLVDNGVVCDEHGCVEKPFLRGLGGLVKR